MASDIARVLAKSASALLQTADDDRFQQRPLRSKADFVSPVISQIFRVRERALNEATAQTALMQSPIARVSLHDFGILEVSR
ncbi:hypothetical protein AS156_12860 [Bradyrhizobium macuxiense]|uniref:Uncharacterized protein n=1 Tax=Bradyrhizobium macuxiense TaxID=1755647 RepID=A0A109JMC7_9BRAD|nr:hypothetical protein AS156_12860 [Bradyrhizobium macuxiense]